MIYTATERSSKNVRGVCLRTSRKLHCRYFLPIARVRASFSVSIKNSEILFSKWNHLWYFYSRLSFGDRNHLNIYSDTFIQNQLVAFKMWIVFILKIGFSSERTRCGIPGITVASWYIRSKSSAKCNKKLKIYPFWVLIGSFKGFRDSFSSIYIAIKRHHMGPIFLKEWETAQGYCESWQYLLIYFTCQCLCV